MRRLILQVLILVAGFLLLFAGCASQPAKGTAGGKEEIPEWVLNPPASDDQYMYFTGSGTGAKGDLAQAEETARGAVIDEIMRYMGVRITSETTATAKASLDSYQTDMTQTLKSKSGGRVTGLEIRDKWTSERSDGLTMYVLARYNKEELLKEKARLEAVFQEMIEAVSGPEREGNAFFAQANYYQAALKYIEAAGAAFKSEIENAEIKFERNINQARDALRGISIIKLTDNIEVFLGEDFAQALAVKVVAGIGERDLPLSEVALRVSYPVIKATGRKSIRSVQIKSGAKGIANFTPPRPEFVGKEKITIALDLGDSLETLEMVPKNLINQVDALEEIALKKKVVVSFESISKAGAIEMGIAIFDLDASGNAIALTETSSGILEELTRANFNVRSLPVAVTSINGRTDAQVAAFLKSNFGGELKRAVYGTARISDHQQDGDFVIIKVTGSIKVVEIESGKILLSVTKSKRAQGTNTSTALSSAFKKLGEDIATNILNNLR